MPSLSSAQRGVSRTRYRLSVVPHGASSGSTVISYGRTGWPADCLRQPSWLVPVIQLPGRRDYWRHHVYDDDLETLREEVTQLTVATQDRFSAQATPVMLK